MGNILAHSTPPPSIPYTTLDSTSDIDSNSAEEKSEIENPGPLEDIHSQCKNIFPTCFDGGRIMLMRGLSRNFQISHSMNMSSLAQNGYRFGTTFVGSNQISPNEAYPVLLGDIDSSGNLNATMLHQLKPYLQAKFGAQIQNSEFKIAQLTLNYKGQDHTSSMIVANPNLISETGVAVLQYFQAVTPKFSLGSEFAYQKGSALPGGDIAFYSLAAKYATKNYQWSGTIGLSGINLCYYQKASNQLQIGIQLESNLRMQEFVTSIGYQVDLSKSGVVFKGYLDTNWIVGSVLEKKLNYLPFTLSFSGMLNHKNGEFRVGLGVVIG